MSCLRSVLIKSISSDHFCRGNQIRIHSSKYTRIIQFTIMGSKLIQIREFQINLLIIQSKLKQQVEMKIIWPKTCQVNQLETSNSQELKARAGPKFSVKFIQMVLRMDKRYKMCQLKNQQTRLIRGLRNHSKGLMTNSTSLIKIYRYTKKLCSLQSKSYAISSLCYLVHWVKTVTT